MTTLEVTIPSAIATQLALPWGGTSSIWSWFKDHFEIYSAKCAGLR